MFPKLENIGLGDLQDAFHLNLPSSNLCARNLKAKKAIDGLFSFLSLEQPMAFSFQGQSSNQLSQETADSWGDIWIRNDSHDSVFIVDYRNSNSVPILAEIPT